MTATDKPITDPEQLQDLPVGAIVVGRTGNGFTRFPGSMQPWRSAVGGYGSSGGDLTEINGRMFRHEGPLTVVWIP